MEEKQQAGSDNVVGIFTLKVWHLATLLFRFYCIWAPSISDVECNSWVGDVVMTTGLCQDVSAAISSSHHFPFSSCLKETTGEIAVPQNEFPRITHKHNSSEYFLLFLILSENGFYDNHWVAQSTWRAGGLVFLCVPLWTEFCLLVCL